MPQRNIWQAQYNILNAISAAFLVDDTTNMAVQWLLYSGSGGSAKFLRTRLYDFYGYSLRGSLLPNISKQSPDTHSWVPYCSNLPTSSIAAPSLTKKYLFFLYFDIL